MNVYYNENDAFAADWLEALIAAGELPAGVVDRRSIEEVHPDDLRGFQHCHFFAGIGGWALAARLAGWPDDRELWSGSCPCQPFSVAGAGAGTEDPRHLWPAFARLIAFRRPATVVGEQVASKAGRAWGAGVRADLEVLGYAVGIADLCAAGVGAPHLRQREWWVADASCYGAERITGNHGETPRLQEAKREPEQCPAVSERGRAHCGGRRGAGEGGRLADADGERVRRRRGDESPKGEVSSEVREQRIRVDPKSDCAAGRCAPGGLGDPEREGLEGHGRHVDRRHESGRIKADAVGSAAASGGDSGMADGKGGRRQEVDQVTGGGDEGIRAQGSERSQCGCGDGPWAGAVWIPCADGKARRIEPGTSPLVDGLPRSVGRARAGMVRGYGNAIVPEQGAVVLAALMDVAA